MRNSAERRTIDPACGLRTRKRNAPTTPVTAQALGRTDQRQPQRQPPVPAIGDDQRNVPVRIRFISSGTSPVLASVRRVRPTLPNRTVPRSIGADVNVVDFESCGWRPRAVDLAAITEHIQSRCTAHEDWEFFIEQFDLDGAERQLLRAVQRQTALRWATRECIDPGTLRSLPDAERLDILLDRVHFVCTSAF